VIQLGSLTISKLCKFCISNVNLISSFIHIIVSYSRWLAAYQQQQIRKTCMKILCCAPNLWLMTSCSLNKQAAATCFQIRYHISVACTTKAHHVQSCIRECRPRLFKFWYNFMSVSHIELNLEQQSTGQSNASRLMLWMRLRNDWAQYLPVYMRIWKTSYLQHFIHLHSAANVGYHTSTSLELIPLSVTKISIQGAYIDFTFIFTR
jgi:hypothetical protein